jgi:amino acid transporter
VSVNDDRTISGRFGVAIAAGVPVLVLVSMGPVAALVGNASIVVWLVSAVIGFLMALIFAELAGGYPRVNGGVAVLAAEVLQPRSRALARVAQWSYWFGWSPALAINGLLVGAYVQRIAFPDGPAWTAALIAGLVLVMSATVNHFGMQVGARLQVVLVACVVAVVGLLFFGALAKGNMNVDHLHPFAPPDGWLSSAGVLGLAGGLFIAGWSAYGSELALSYATRYRSGVMQAIRVLVVVALVSVFAFGVIPFLLLTVVGPEGLRADPADAFMMLSERSTDVGANVVLGVLVLALVLGLNMIALASSWTLHQMSARGDAWPALGRLNRHGMPAQALRFDVGVNLLLIAVLTALARGNTAQVPIALLAAANVGYFISMTLALAAAWLNHRRPVRRGLLRLRTGLARLGPAIAGLNILMLASAAWAWGWQNIAVGTLMLGGIVGLGAIARRGRRATVPTDVTMPPCWGRAEAATAPRQSGTRYSRERGGERHDSAGPHRVDTRKQLRPGAVV